MDQDFQQAWSKMPLEYKLLSHLVSGLCLGFIVYPLVNMGDHWMLSLILATATYLLYSAPILMLMTRSLNQRLGSMSDEELEKELEKEAKRVKTRFKKMIGNVAEDQRQYREKISSFAKLPGGMESIVFVYLFKIVCWVVGASLSFLIIERITN